MPVSTFSPGALKSFLFDPKRKDRGMKQRAKTFVACVAVATLMFRAPAVAATAVVTQATPACVSWAGWHDWLLASLTPKGAGPNKYCPTYIDKGTKVDVLEADDGEGAATIRWRNKTWFTHADRLRE
jgi:hypothetical protein